MIGNTEQVYVLIYNDILIPPIPAEIWNNGNAYINNIIMNIKYWNWSFERPHAILRVKGSIIKYPKYAYINQYEKWIGVE